MTARMAKILTVGEIMLELSETEDGMYRKSFAGDTFNLGYYLMVASGGAHQVDYLTVLGTDASSEQCLRFMRAHGVGVSPCVRDPDRTIGLFLLTNDARGEKCYHYWRGQSAARNLFNVPRDFSGYDWVCFSGITAAIVYHRERLVAAVRAASEKGARLAYDCNYRSLLWRADDASAFSRGVFPQMDVVKISDDELALLFPGESMATLSQSYPGAEWVLTCKSHKSEAWKNGALLAKRAFLPVSAVVVDTSGAGDAFLAAYLAAKLDGEQPEDALRRGHAVSSQVVCAKGSITDVKT